MIKRSHCLILSNKKVNINNLASIFNVSRRTIERWIVTWELHGEKSLKIQDSRGAKLLLKGLEDKIQEQLVIHNRNIKNILDYLEKSHNISICKRTLQNFLKDTGI